MLRHESAVVRPRPGHSGRVCLCLGPERTAAPEHAELSAAGGAIAPNLIIFGQAVVDSAIDPKIEETGIGSANGKGSADLTGVGGGIAYYVMPANLYLSASLLASRVRIADENGNEVGRS